MAAEAFKSRLKAAEAVSDAQGHLQAFRGASEGESGGHRLEPGTAFLLAQICDGNARRRIRIAMEMQKQGRVLTRDQVMKRFCVSRATAARDLAALRKVGLI